MMQYMIYSDLYKIYPDENASDVKLNLGLNQAGKLSFMMYDTHPNFSRVLKLASVIKVYKSGITDPIWTGRVIGSEQYFDNSVMFTCEGLMATFNDIPLYPYAGSDTPTQYLTYLLARYNTFASQQITLGTVEYADLISRESDVPTTIWEALNTQLIDKLGGYLILRYSGATVYLDYKSTLTGTSSQVIEYGSNLLDLQNIIDATNTFTAVFPLGTEIVTEPLVEGDPEIRERLDIKLVNSGVDYITNPTYTALYGVIFAPTPETTWDDTTVDSVLLAKAQAHLATGIALKSEIKLSAVDLSYVENVDSFDLGDTIHVQSTPHGIHDDYLLTEMEIDISSPDGTTVTIGKASTTLTDFIHDSNTRLAKSEDYIEKITKDYVVNGQITEVYEELTKSESSILQTANSIITNVLEEYATKTDLSSAQTIIESQLTQTANGFGFDFSTQTVKELIDTLGGTISSDLTELKSYVRIENGIIKLGKSDSVITLEMDNDSIVFKLNGQELASWTSDTFNITKVDVATQLNVGAFAFVPRSDGNMSFKKI